jgi:hydroxyacylglutathione hydrolase
MVERIIVGPLSTNCYLYSRWKKECLIIDPGGDPDKIIAHMTGKNLTPRGIILTHGHLDHIAALGKILDHYLDKDILIKIAAHPKDKQFFGPIARAVHQSGFVEMGSQANALFEELYHPIPDLDIFLDENESVFDCDLQVLYTPGHTEGGVSFYSEESGELFSGDTLFFEGVGRTDLPGGDQKLLIQSIKEKLLSLPDATRVFPGHGPITSIERERSHNPFL